MPSPSATSDKLTLISQRITLVNRTLCVGVSFATLLMVVITFAIVVLRYGIGVGWIAMQESVMYLHATVFMIGIAFTLADDAHVRVDVFYHKMSLQKRSWVNALGTVLLLFPVCLFIISYSFRYVVESWGLLEASQEAGGLPLVFLLKSLIPIGAILLLLQGVSVLLNSINQLRNLTR
ncbi:TRAP transporter small permease subunit [Alteromonas sp. ASW11-130]|uniref:TRAP transporter small permease subunit n=1 Tax=Alteromonas sp. ASW11-130 TaxID=3015775 RepID=UPI002242C268|nr:TRAP transporter small permease subunit [Alteromonas sp. ASW11-130]MCW8092634.1 TRAP transporter small permease subunit [Alteromonas sp. ASW11-130]